MTANEIHIPTGQPLLVQLASADVIHDFWVPKLGRKMDAIPGHPNQLWLQADQPGTYLGACAEFCGAQHAWMRLRVIAQSPTDFAAWQQAQRQSPPPPPATDTLASQGAKRFQALTCSNCHAIGGTPAQANAGPNLTHVASRQTLGAGVLENNPANLAQWLTNPQSVKPGNQMPHFQLSAADLQALVAYLETLQ
ncbi:MAG: c-type cytochrome [Caldilineaceae bacterium]